MIDDLLHSSVVLWATGLIFGVPLVLVALSEVIERMRRADSAYEGAFETLRNLFIPVVALVLITTHVLQLPESSVWQRLAQTLLFFVSGMTVLSMIAAMRVYDKDRDRWEARVPGIAKTVVRVLAVILPFALMVTVVWDLDLTKLLTAIGVGSVALAFALQSTLSSVISGLLLALDKPFREGDFIEIDGHVGEVIDLNWRTTRLLVDGRDVVVIPNTQLLDSSLRNYTVVDAGYRDKIDFGFAYKDAPNLVKDTALRVARECPLVSDMPAPEVHMVAYGDSSVNYELHFHCARYLSPFQASRTRDELMTRLFYAADREGLEIPFPIRTVRSTGEGDTTPEDVAEMLRASSSLHAVLGRGHETARALLSEGAELRNFGRGYVITEIGDHDRGIGLIESGAVRVEDADGNAVDYLPQGQLIGTRYLVGRRANKLRLVAAEDGALLFMPGASVDRAMDADPALARALGDYADLRLASYSRKEEASRKTAPTTRKL